MAMKINDILWVIAISFFAGFVSGAFASAIINSLTQP